MPQYREVVQGTGMVRPRWTTSVFFIVPIFGILALICLGLGNLL